MDKKLSKIPQWLGFILLLSFITAGATLTIFSPLYANGIINVLIPILILIFFKSEFFEKLKLSTLAIGRFLVVMTVLGFLSGDWLVTIIIWLLRLNILEATLTDYKNKSYFNVISGIVLIGTSFALTGGWNGTFYLTTNEAMLFWALAYTLWNWTFVIYEFKHQIGFYHIAVLLAPLLFVTFAAQPGFWLIARANTLTFAGIFQITGKKQIEGYLTNKTLEKAIEKIKDKRVQLLIMLITVILAFLPLVLPLLK